MSDSQMDDSVSEPVAKPVGANEMAGRVDLQLVDLIEFVWTCEASARQLDRIYAAFKCGRLCKGDKDANCVIASPRPNLRTDIRTNPHVRRFFDAYGHT